MKKSLIATLLAVAIVVPVFAVPPKSVKKNIKHPPKQVVKKDVKQQPMESVREINVEPEPVIEPGLQNHNPNEDLKKNKSHNTKKPVRK